MRDTTAEVTVTVSVALPSWREHRTAYAVAHPEADFRAFVAAHAAAITEQPEARDSKAHVSVRVDGRDPADVLAAHLDAVDEFRAAVTR